MPNWVGNGTYFDNGNPNSIVYANANMSLVNSGLGWDGTNLNISDALTISKWAGGCWINMPTSGPSGIGFNGPGNNAMIAYVNWAGEYFNDSQVGDVVSRIGENSCLRLGTASPGGFSSMQISTNFINFAVPISLPSISDSSALNNQLYFSATSGKLTYKDPNGNFHSI